MADAETDVTAQLQPSTPSTSSSTTTTQAEGVPANVVEAINKPNDLVPALFALPCESSDTKKLKLCKRVGWLQDRVFTTGYMEINVREAKQKGIFKRPRRVTLVRREDSSLQSTEIGAGSKAPTCSQLSNAMLTSNTSATALVDIKGELVPNTILVDKGNVMISEETSGKLVALNGRDSPMEVRSDEKHTGNFEIPRETIKDPAEKQKPSDKPSHGDITRENVDKNNTSSSSSDSDIRESAQVSGSAKCGSIKSARDGGNHLTTTEYFLTEEGKASPASEPDEDYPSTPAIRTLKHLVQIADANRKESDSGSGDSPALTEEQVDKDSSKTHHSDQVSQPQEKQGKKSSEETVPPARRKSQETQPSKRPSLKNVVDTLRSKILDKKNNSKLNTESGVLNPNSDSKDFGAHIDHSYVLVNREKPLNERSYCFGSNQKKDVLNTGNQNRPANQKPSPDPPDTNSVSNGDPSLESSFAPGPTAPISSASDATLKSTLSEIKSATAEQVTHDACKSDSSSDEVSEGMPTLRIGSVYSLSEEEAKERFPDSKPPKPEPEPVKSTRGTDLTNPVPNLGVTANTEQTDTSISQAIKIGCQIQSSEKAAVASQKASTFPFPNSSNVKLYNITPSKKSPGKKAVYVPISTVVQNAPANLAQSNLNIPVTSSTGGVKEQQPMHRPATQLFTLIPSTITSAPVRPNQSQLVSLVPVQVGTLQGTVVNAPRAVPTFPHATVQATPPIATHLPVRLSTSIASSPLKLQTPAVVNKPVGTQGKKRIVVTKVCKDTLGNVEALQKAYEKVRDENQVLSLSSCATPKTFAASGVVGSGRAVVSSAKTASGQSSMMVSGSSADSVTGTKTVMIRKDLTVPTAKASEAPSKSGTDPCKQPGANPVTYLQRKTFLITTSNGEKRLVSMPADADAASILSQMSSNKGLPFIIPHKSGAEKTGSKNDNQEKTQKSDDTPSNRSPKEAKTSSNKHSRKSRSKIKKRPPILKIKFGKEPPVGPKEDPQAEPDVRRSTRDKKLKRPYSPPSEVSKIAKVCRSESPVVIKEETKLSPKAEGTAESPVLCVKTEPVGSDLEPTYSDKDMTGEEDSLPTKPPSPPTYVDREERVRRLKEIMKEKEKALEEILLKRKRELEERLADPELYDL